MAENNTDGQPQGNPDEGSNPNTGAQPPVSSAPDTQPELDPSEKARRELQSKRDKGEAQNAELQEQVDAMQPYVARMAQKELVDTFLSENGENYPHVKAEDLVFAGVSSPEEAKAVAEWLEGRLKTADQEALSKVQDTQDLSMTEAEKAEALKKLEKEEGTPGQSKFLQALRIKATKTK